MATVARVLQALHKKVTDATGRLRIKKPKAGDAALSQLGDLLGVVGGMNKRLQELGRWQRRVDDWQTKLDERQSELDERQSDLDERLSKLDRRLSKLDKRLSKL